jgi:fucose permease
LSIAHQHITLAIRLLFLLAGFAVSCWAPLIPIVKQKLQLDEAMLGLMLLCLGVGSILVMSLSGVLTARFGSRRITMMGGIVMTLTFPALVFAPNVMVLAFTLVIFGVALGGLEVAMNVNAIDAEKQLDKSLMSGFHGMFSVGGFIGAGFMTGLLTLGITAEIAVFLCSLMMLVMITFASKGVVNQQYEDDSPHFMMPRGVVILLALLAAIIFMAEGAMLDWGGLLMLSKGGINIEQSGLAYMLFAIAMTIGRFYGDRITSKLGDFNVVLGGGMLAALGFVLVIFPELTAINLMGFFLIGTGSSNIVPIIYRRAGSQTLMPVTLAVAGISIFGYGGILIGPTLIGFVAHSTSLVTAFKLLAILWLIVPICARSITR